MMKKLVMVIACVLLIPAISNAALCSGNYYRIFIFSPASNGVVTATIVFSEENVLKQGTVSLEYGNGAIGTGSYSSSLPILIFGIFDFYNTDRDYFPCAFNAVTTGIFIYGFGSMEDVITGDYIPGFFYGFFQEDYRRQDRQFLDRQFNHRIR